MGTIPRDSLEAADRIDYDFVQSAKRNDAGESELHAYLIPITNRS